MESKLQFWQKHFKAAKQSKYSIREYCKIHHLSIASYYYYYSKRNQKSKIPPNEQSKFKEITVEKEITTNETKINMPFGITLELNQLPDTKWLSGLLWDLSGKGQ